MSINRQHASGHYLEPGRNGDGIHDVGTGLDRAGDCTGCLGGRGAPAGPRSRGRDAPRPRRADDPIAQHHTLGGRKISAVDPSLLGLPVLPFAVMAEMTAQVAALVVTPGLVLTGLKQVRAHKWVRYEEEPVYLELRGQRVPSTDDERVWVGIFNRGTDGKAEAPRPVFEAIAVFGESVPAPPPAAAWSLENARPSKFTAESVYDEQWLFHGPLFQAIARVGNALRTGDRGTIARAAPGAAGQARSSRRRSTPT